MNPRERVLTAVEHSVPDRVPFDLGSSKVTGIARNACLRLAKLPGRRRGRYGPARCHAATGGHARERAQTAGGGHPGIGANRLKLESGPDLAFWGGPMAALDHATFSPPEVKRAVRRSIQDLAPGGGFVFGAVHITQDDVPPENLMALWEGFLEVRGY